MYWSGKTPNYWHGMGITPMYHGAEGLAILAENGYIGPKRAYIVTFFLVMLDTWFWCLTPGFWVWKILWDHFPEPQIDLKVKNRVVGCKRPRTTTRGEIATLAPNSTEHARNLILVSNPMVLGMENHLGPFTGASDRSDGQEQGGGIVRGQGQLQGVKL